MSNVQLAPGPKTLTYGGGAIIDLNEVFGVLAQFLWKNGGYLACVRRYLLREAAGLQEIERSVCTGAQRQPLLVLLILV